MILQDYLKSIQNISPQDKELTFASQFQNFLLHLKEYLSSKKEDLENIQIIHQPNNDKGGGGAPDFSFLKQGLILGYIETKRVNANLKELLQSEQIAKYSSKLSTNIILSDYLNFILIGEEKGKIIIKKEVKICDLDELKSLANTKNGGGFLKIP